MDPASIAAAQIGAQLALAQSNVAVKLIKQGQELQQQMIAMLDDAAPPPPEGTGLLLNARG